MVFNTGQSGVCRQPADVRTKIRILPGQQGIQRIAEVLARAPFAHVVVPRVPAALLGRAHLRLPGHQVGALNWMKNTPLHFAAQYNKPAAVAFLLKQGANPWQGRQLRSLFADKGLVNVVAGVMGGQWQMPFDQEEWKSEWEVLESDLEINIETNPTYQAYKLRDYQAWTSGERILYVPTFFAWGMVPD